MRKPHVCPVCGGNGIVPNRFYVQTSGAWVTTDITPEKCRTCDGTGVIWENYE
jgi:DnaJ-class molecular chaperone